VRLQACRPERRSPCYAAWKAKHFPGAPTDCPLHAASALPWGRDLPRHAPKLCLYTAAGWRGRECRHGHHWHKTRAIFDRYSIGNEQEIAEALTRVQAHVHAQSVECGLVVPITKAAEGRG
jgi:hypothetical protein